MSRTHNIVYVVGLPGAGKTTALRRMATPPDRMIEDSEVRWTVKDGQAFIGTYKDLALDGGDNVARHANYLSMIYWRHYLLPDPTITTTFLDGEMFLRKRIFYALESNLDFIYPVNPEDLGDPKGHYKPGGRYYDTFKAITEMNQTRFPTHGVLGKDPQVRLNCIFLNLSENEASRRRLARNSVAESEGSHVNSEKHMKSAAGTQRNFAEWFRDRTRDVDAFFMPTGTDMTYREIDVSTMNPDQVYAEIGRFVKELPR